MSGIRHMPSDCPDGTQCAKTIRVYKTHAHAWAAVAKHQRQPDQFWEYRDRSGELVGLVLRWDTTGGRKDFRPLARVVNGWIVGANAAAATAVSSERRAGRTECVFAGVHRRR